jgi:hypothetical protein
MTAIALDIINALICASPAIALLSILLSGKAPPSNDTF